MAQLFTGNLNMVSRHISFAYIIPGFRQTTRASAYRKIMRAFREAGVKPVGIRIKWKRTVLSQNIEEFLSQLRAPQEGGYCILGFSFGAMVALVSASRGLMPERLFLCSLSPFFAEQTPRSPAAKRSLGKRRLADFQSIRFNNVVSDIRSKTEIFVGSNEDAAVIKMARSTRRRLRRSRLFIVRNSGHDIGNPAYLSAVCKRISSLT
jgi:thioesterase domain-containing protein